VRRYELGESANVLVAEFGVDRRTLTAQLRRAGADVRYRVLNDADVDAARELYESGQSLAVVGEQLGVAARTVLNALRRAGVSTRAPGTNQWSQGA
jgi:hypothetical protein